MFCNICCNKAEEVRELVAREGGSGIKNIEEEQRELIKKIRDLSKEQNRLQQEINRLDAEEKALNNRRLNKINVLVRKFMTTPCLQAIRQFESERSI